jgi:hypothetical protein
VTFNNSDPVPELLSNFNDDGLDKLASTSGRATAQVCQDATSRD